MDNSARYRHYGIEEFVSDPFFQQWVLSSDSATDAFWSVWLVENPDRLFVVEEARRMVRLLGFTTDHSLNERLLRTWVLMEKGVVNHHGRAIRDRPLRSWVYKAAAVFLTVAICGMTLWYLYFTTTTVHTDFGKISSVTLPDGSVVDLNANSSLEYAKNWDGQGPREVWLKGEAFFSVAHSPDQKFIVHTAEGITVNVLGTTFNVLSRRTTMRVSLNTGKIHVALPQAFTGEDNKPLTDGFVMVPGEVAEFNLETSSITRHPAEVEKYVFWKEGKMFFDNTSMEEVAVLIQDIHGLNVHVDESLKERRITGEFRSDDLDILVQFIARAMNARVIRDTEEIRFETE